MNIQDLIAQGESSTIEFKSSFGNKAIETIVAFANSEGGKVVLGVDDDKNIIGIQLYRNKSGLQKIHGFGVGITERTKWLKGKPFLFQYI